MDEPITLDFETYYKKVNQRKWSPDDYSVGDLGPEAYCNDRRFDAYMVAIVGRGIRFVGPPAKAPWEKLRGVDLVAHNAGFERAVCRRLRRDGVIPFDLATPAWHDTADLAAFLGVKRNLKSAVKYLLGTELSKDMRSKMNGVTWVQACAKGWADRMLAYCLSDATTTAELWEKHSSSWPAHEQLISRLNLEWGERGVYIDVPRLHAGYETLQEQLWEAKKRIPWADGSEDETIIDDDEVAKLCRARGIPVPDSLAESNEAGAEWLETYADQVPEIGAMRDWRRINTLLQRLRKMRWRLRSDGTIPMLTKYFGAHTGRFSGDGGINPQNMSRDELFGVDVRGLILPRPGCKFGICDTAQIEPRILMWLVRNEGVLAAIKGGMSIYEVHARATMGWTGGKLKAENNSLYRLAKTRVIQLGYQCGPPKFRTTAKRMENLDLTEEEADDNVRDYRRKNPEVVALWHQLDRDLKWSMGDSLEVELPSGRMLTYRDVHRRGREVYATVVRGSPAKPFYGGKITENMCQAIGRDIFCEYLIYMHRHPRKCGTTVMHVHDEAINEVPEDAPDGDVIRELEKAMSRTPRWLAGCPLGAEAKVKKGYGG